MTEWVSIPEPSSIRFIVFLYIRAYSFCLESVNRSFASDLPLDCFLGTRLLHPSVVLHYGPMLTSYCFSGHGYELAAVTLCSHSSLPSHHRTVYCFLFAVISLNV